VCLHVNDSLVNQISSTTGDLTIIRIASVSRYTLSHVVPHLTRLFVDPDELPNRGPVLSLLSSLIAAARDSTVKADNAEDIFLLPFKDEVLGVLVTGLKAQSSLRSAIEGLNGIVTTPALLDDQEVGFVVQKVNDVISSQQEDLFGTRCSFLTLSTELFVDRSALEMQPSIYSRPSPTRPHLISHR
jgi:DNA repair/transcription protein MET18/MMS19